MNKQVDDKMELRRRNVRRYKLQSGDEWQTIAKQIGVSPSDLSQRLNGARAFTEKFARQVETRLKLSTGWLDSEHEDAPLGTASQIGDKGLLSSVITAIDDADRLLKGDGHSGVRDSDKYAQIVEFIYEDSVGRGMPKPDWLLRLLRLILD